MKSDKRSVTSDVRIIHQSEVELLHTRAIHQEWIWKNVTGESIVFDKNFALEKRDDELKSEVARGYFHSNPPALSVSRMGETVAVNFNFKIGSSS